MMIKPGERSLDRRHIFIWPTV